MGIPYAEVIGDPIAHSKSPLIHKFWLAKLGIEGDFHATLVKANDLTRFLADRRGNGDWRGCSVTLPHKQAMVELLDARYDGAIGAINCAIRRHDGYLTGYNTDLDGIVEALPQVELSNASVCLIGAGGAARALVAYLLDAGVNRVAFLARDPGAARQLWRSLPRRGSATMSAEGFDQARAAMNGATLIVNATPLGMPGAPRMTSKVLEALAASDRSGVVVFDMVYAPAETEFLATARRAGANVVDGLPMLIGQAAKAFELFFREPAPRRLDGELRELLLR
jgi:shikimate dehydrogenase